MKKTTQTGALAALAAGSRFQYGGVEWVVLEQSGSVAVVLAADVLEQRAFDEDNKNDFAASSLRAYLNGKFIKKLVEAGADEAAFISVALDLTSDDGLKDYGTDKVRIGLISCEQYRRFRDIIPNASDWWWTCTPFSTERNGYSCGVRSVSTSGALNVNYACGGNYGVRPLCNLKSDISVSFHAADAQEATQQGEFATSIEGMVRAIHKNAVDHGWWDENRSFPEILALCHSELSEALEEYRDDMPQLYYRCKVCISEGYEGAETVANGEECENGCCEECADRCEKPEGVAVELADCVIRIFDYCGQAGIDIAEAIRLKHEYNKSRPYRHGGKKC